MTGSPDLFRVLAKALGLAAVLVAAVWFLDEILTVVLFFLAAVVLAIVLNPPVSKMERRGVPRVVGSLVVVIGLVAALGAILWLITPRLVREGQALRESLPTIVSNLRTQATNSLEGYPEAQQEFSEEKVSDLLVETVRGSVSKVWRYSLTLIGAIIGFLLLLATVLYMLASPRPLLRGYLALYPPRMRDQAARAFARGSEMAVGWLWANAIVGLAEGAIAWGFLKWLGVPAALVWGVLAFFAELVPRLGAYLMAVPPILVALAIDPMTALYVTIFYIVLQNVFNLVTPLIQGQTMNLHPVSLIFAVLAMSAAFGLVGALIATPLAALIKAHYEEFALRGRPDDPEESRRVEEMLLARKVEPPPPS